MSKFVKIRTELRDLTMIKRALDDLKLNYQENANYRHEWSGASHTAELVVTAGMFTSFGLRRNDEGVYEILGDNMGLSSQQETLQQLNQRYAYHKVLNEVGKAGFSLVEEATDRNKAIRLVVRRWA
ncbi:MAG: DUF1257 domain-containing protein [Anaerolineae bacterium]|uniref:DUF1257 domain-containing protein n=1 Tax=Candidatus Amarolinea dominans TaxID=3140696 RepID=UPI0031361A76|nr:DUF1257 domain-containing protein [Anaerolineae bacterium]MBK9232690.1 DUF1257 domain-containing protein [Anaerolineae bacterium]